MRQSEPGRARAMYQAMIELYGDNLGGGTRGPGPPSMTNMPR